MGILSVRNVIATVLALAVVLMSFALFASQRTVQFVHAAVAGKDGSIAAGSQCSASEAHAHKDDTVYFVGCGGFF